MFVDVLKVRRVSLFVSQLCIFLAVCAGIKIRKVWKLRRGGKSGGGAFPTQEEYIPHSYQYRHEHSHKQDKYQSIITTSLLFINLIISLSLLLSPLSFLLSIFPHSPLSLPVLSIKK
jgi:hypothetical protein